MKRILKKENMKYILLFFLFLGWQLFYNNLFCDYLWSYGFSYNIITGLDPYQDFNMVVPPLTSILFSIPLIFSKGIHIFAISYSILLTIICYFMFRLFGKKTYLFLLFFFIPSPLFIFLCNYNLLLYLFFLLLIYLEKEEHFDYTVGIIASLSFFTKQSIGFLFILASLYLAKDKTRIKKRLIGVVSIFVLFFFYFLMNHNLYSFIDQCFLGMFNFYEKNRNFNLVFFLFLGMIIYTLNRIIKNREEKSYYYVLCFLFFNYPTFDSAHFVLSLVVFLSLFVERIKESVFYFYIFVLPIFFISFNLLVSDFKGHFIYPNQVSNFEYYYLPDYVVENIKQVNQFVEKNRNKRIVFITSTSYVYKISNHLRVERYLDLLNYGNMGFDGSNNAIREIKNYSNDTIFLVDDLLLKQNIKRKTQLDQKVLEYFYRNTKVVGVIENFTIYQKK